MTDSISRMATLADGTPAMVGDIVYNYYDMHQVVLGEPIPGIAGWFDTKRIGGGNGPMLNGERMCSMEFARRADHMDADAT